jgi:hypothetical protein
MSGKVSPTLKKVLGMIDAVHDDGKLDPIDFFDNYRGRAYGVFRRLRGGSCDIVVRRSGETHHELTLLHEIGHWLDAKALPGPGFSSDTHDLAGGLLSGWWNAVQDSQAYQQLKMRGHSKHRSYLIQRLEIWARSYAQYIATRTKDPVALAQLNDIIGGKTAQWIEAHWTETDFKPIAAELDKIMEKLGWL